MSIQGLLIALTLCFTGACARPVPTETALPTAVTTTREMVVTAHPLATQAGARILEMGGTAVDAMIAAQAVLGLVEPQSSGLGGGAFVVYHQTETGRTITVDGREKAPQAAREDRFLIQGRPMEFHHAWQSGLSVGVPGVPRLLEHLHQRYGRLPWSELFVPARTLAREGFPLTARTSALASDLLARNSSCAEDERLFFRDPAAFAYLVETETCTAKPAGTWMRNPAYAETLERLAAEGADAFYLGPLAEAIVAAVQGDRRIPGDLTAADLENYQVVERPPVCVAFRGHQVCGMGPPSSGALAVGQILRFMELRSDLLGTSPLDVDSVHLFTQAMRLAFADRNLYVADSDFVKVPVAGLLDETYLAARAALITPWDMGSAAPGMPPGAEETHAAENVAPSQGTSQISVLDRYGNALSLTSSIESAFGNGVMVQGFFLNNQLTDFSFAPRDAAGRPLANRVQPGKRPRSSMAPTIVLAPDDRVALVTGSPGGARIIGYTAQSLLNILAFGLDPQQTIQVPHIINLNGQTELEAPLPGVTLDYDVQALATALMARGHSDPAAALQERLVDIVAHTSGLAIIQVVRSATGQAVLIGGADQRRDGAVGGR
ncbi:gamma-glutamyltransferase family protein [Geoalkalibacter sp.]|uniref:gamma-glutamyltransferase family protein n=1 Tax=Geoalkalibacter sp. TaxID=3041440 RepID=UPI00272DDECC|nr:gamma-glutamyltransferase family protein [Geoalkalibacter sp.]